MRTTVDLPPELMRAAKARAAEQGESFKEWFTRAVTHALGRGAHTPASAGPWPVFGRSGGRKVRLTNEDLARIDVAEDVERLWRGRRRAR